MISADCDSIRDELDAFVDGELRGADLRRVSQHVEACRRCTDEIEGREQLGGLIRDAVAKEYETRVPSGLAAGVVARTRAESYFSWRSGLGRAVDDWHWVIVGGGAMSGTLLSMLFCAAVLLLGTAAPNEDSLSTLGKNLRSSPGTLYAEVSRQGEGQGVIFVQVDTGDAAQSSLPALLRRGDEEQMLLGALGETLGRGGPFVQSAAERRYAEFLMDSIARLRRAEPTDGRIGTLTVHRLHLVASAEVTAKGLE